MPPELRKSLARELHKYALGLMVIFLLFAITFALAFVRFDQHEKFAEYQLYLKWLTIERKLQKPFGK
ncbi:hypothetical protein [Fortiea contorta]|uniref:hypothetical protein n=1 Tax=Fortiea contorta TaxID=1892405 RepID=UPI000345D545|nr:hypothetical protein [Fortiea contorta]